MFHDFFARSGKVQDGSQESLEQGVESQADRRRGSVSSVMDVPGCCELKILDVLITVICMGVLIITVVGYTIILSDRQAVDVGASNNTETLVHPDFPIPWNESQVVDEDYHEFFLRCRSYRIGDFRMGCEYLEPHLVMKDVTHVGNDED